MGCVWVTVVRAQIIIEMVRLFIEVAINQQPAICHKAYATDAPSTEELWFRNVIDTINENWNNSCFD